MAYQSFDGEIGDSNSAAKLACLHLPEDLSGKTVLDIGCNEGYFVREALRRGATKAVGIDMSSDLIAKAKKRTPEGDFRVMSWWDFGTEKFDFILFLSAIHYEKDQRRLLTKLSYNLNLGGILILECGIASERSLEWKIVDRHDGVVRFPTVTYLEENILSSYASRILGNSVKQSGDPVNRYVLHCTPKMPHIHIVSGWSKSGKSNFCHQLNTKGIRVVSTDVVMSVAKQHMADTKDSFISYMAKTLEFGRIDIFAKKMVEDGKAADFCRFVLRFVSSDEDMTVVEGFPFIFPEVMEEFKKAAAANGFRCSVTMLEGGIPSFKI